MNTNFDETNVVRKISIDYFNIYLTISIHCELILS